MTSITEQLLALERKLSDPRLRNTPEKLAPLLADDFLEFGSSGRTYDKEQVLNQLGKQTYTRMDIEEFLVTQIAPTAALASRVSPRDADRRRTRLIVKPLHDSGVGRNSPTSAFFLDHLGYRQCQFFLPRLSNDLDPNGQPDG
jgi:hypothetical protein